METSPINPSVSLARAIDAADDPNVRRALLYKNYFRTLRDLGLAAAAAAHWATLLSEDKCTDREFNLLERGIDPARSGVDTGDDNCDSDSDSNYDSDGNGDCGVDPRLFLVYGPPGAPASKAPIAFISDLAYQRIAADAEAHPWHTLTTSERARLGGRRKLAPPAPPAPLAPPIAPPIADTAVPPSFNACEPVAPIAPALPADPAEPAKRTYRKRAPDAFPARLAVMLTEIDAAERADRLRQIDAYQVQRAPAAFEAMLAETSSMPCCRWLDDGEQFVLDEPVAAQRAFWWMRRGAEAALRSNLETYGFERTGTTAFGWTTWRQGPRDPGCFAGHARLVRGGSGVKR